MLRKEDNPWLGLASYEIEDSDRFFGREEELAELKTSICKNTFTTLYGISGVGKTSLVNAGLNPLLEKENYLSIRIRLEHSSSTDYNAQIIAAIKSAVDNVGGEIEAFSELDINSLNKEEQLWYFLFTSRFWSKDNYQLTPVLFLDQFEEIFTKNEESERHADFFNTINALQYNLPSTHISELLEKDNSYIKFNKVARFRMVFVIREDFLARLEDYSINIPALRHNRRGIKRMNGNQALDVILKPNPSVISREVALKIIYKVAGKTVKDTEQCLLRLSIDTSILSLFCSELYQQASDEKMETITMSSVEQFGDNIISSFYSHTMKMVSKKTAGYLETHLLTYSGFRNSLALEDIVQNGIDEQELLFLSEKRLIRIETIENVQRVEFTHDVLCKVAKEKKEERKAKEAERSYKKVAISYCVVSTIVFFLSFLLYFLYLIDLV